VTGPRTKRACAGLSSAALLSLAAPALAGCGEAKRARFDCSCSYVTDTDVPGTVDVSICAKDATDARERAGDCATSLGVGLAQDCTCRAEAQPCPPSSCQQTAALGD
jgi:hypothetical protein